LDVVSVTEEAAGGNEDPGPINDREMRRIKEKGREKKR
jgi:hypothetical protein